MLTAEDGRQPSVPDEMLNLIYNACDAGLNTGIAARANARKPGLSWQSVGARWNDALQEVLQ